MIFELKYFNLDDLQSNESHYAQTGNFTPTLEKLLSSSGRSNEVYAKRFESQNRHYSNDEMCNFIAINPKESRFSNEFKGNMLRTALHAVCIYFFFFLFSNI